MQLSIMRRGMVMNFKRSSSIVILVVFICIILVMFTSCFKVERYLFDEKKYVLRNKPLEWTEELIVDDAYLNFTKISDEEYQQTEPKTNLLQNRKNKECYRIDFMLKFLNYGEVHCDCDYLGKKHDMVDMYHVNMSFKISGKQVNIYNVSFMLHGQNAEIGSRTVEVTLAVKEIYIDGQKVVCQEAQVLLMYAK